MTFVAQDLQPLAIVESPAFHRVLEMAEPRYTMPSRKHLSNQLIPKRYTRLFSTTVALLKKAPQVCVTLDMWTNRQMRSYFGMTAHFIVDFKLMSVMLACRRFSGSHTGEEILQHYEDVEHAFAITGKVDNIVTDNGANITRAFRLLEIDYESQPDTFELDTDEEELQPVEDLSDDDLYQIKPKHYPCFAHTIQLVIKDGLANADQIKRVLGKASRLVNHVRHSTLASELFENVGRLQTANVTRWNSQLTMLKSLLKVSNSSAMQQLDYNGKLNVHELNIVKDIIEILTPFKWATDLTQGQNVVTVSYILPVIRGLRIEMNNLCQKYNSRFTTTLKASFERRMFKYENEEIFKFAAVLDPRWKMAWCTEDESVELKHIILEKARSESDDVRPSIEETTTASEEPPPKKVSKLFEFMQARAGASTLQSENDPVLHQLEEYLSSANLDEKEKPLTFWKEKELDFPQLAKLAGHYLQTPASSGPVERLFSIGGKIFRPERCRLSDVMFEKLMFIRCNTDIDLS